MSICKSMGLAGIDLKWGADVQDMNHSAMVQQVLVLTHSEAEAAKRFF